MAIPRYKSFSGPALLSAGFRPFFLLSAIWALIAVPVWLLVYTGGPAPLTAMAPIVWHPHELIYGYGGAVVAGFLLTAIPNWTGRLPLQGWPLASLVILWIAGRIAVCCSAVVGAPLAAAVDLLFPIAFLAVVSREIVAGRNWRNLPMLGALSMLLAGNVLVHLETLGAANTAQLGNRIGVATLLALIGLIGGRIVPSFTRNWLVKNRPSARLPAPSDTGDLAAMIVTAASVALWAFEPEGRITAIVLMAGGAAAGWRLSRWRGWATTAEFLLLDLHIGYAWLAAGLFFVGLNEFAHFMPQTSALHALTVGAIGTMTLAVMTRATLGHTGRPLTAGPITSAIYICISLAAMLRLIAAVALEQSVWLLWAAGAAWSAAFLLFAIFYGRLLTVPRASGEKAAAV